jgi:hypothetical protein
MRSLRRFSAAIMVSIGGALIQIPAAAHPHDETPIGAREAADIAREMITELVALKTIGASWANALPLEHRLLQRNGERAWVLTFLNPASNKEEERVLYIFLATNGEFIAANHTGQ